MSWMNKIRPVLIPLAICVATVVLFFTFYLGGFLGFSVLGVAICLVAARLDARNAPAETAAPDALYPQQMTKAERAAFWETLATRPQPLIVARLVGAALIALGLLGFALFSFGV